MLHGFTGNPQSMRPLAEAIAADGYSVELPLLPGHGTAIEDMVPTRWADYVAAVDAAYDDLARRSDAVAVVALSMGGTLACRLAEHHSEIVGLAVVNPMIDPPAQSFRDVFRGILDSGADVAPGVGSDIAKEGSTELAYAGSPIAAALSFFEGVDEVAAGLHRIACPVLVLSSRQDHVVPSSSGDVLVAGVSGPVERVWLERSYHVATLDFDADVLTARTVGFVRTVLGSAAGSATGSAGGSAAGSATGSAAGSATGGGMVAGTTG